MSEIDWVISSRILGSSMVAGIDHSSPSAILRIVPRRILPDLVLGRRSTTRTILKAATAPIRSRTKATNSASMSVPDGPCRH